MNIRDALLAAMSTPEVIRRESRDFSLHLIPHESQIIVSLPNGTRIIGWQPTEDDLLANDWTVSGISKQGLNIQEACQIAKEQNKYITQPWISVHLKTKPTNTEQKCIGMNTDGSDPIGKWQPTIEELIATDWQVVD